MRFAIILCWHHDRHLCTFILMVGNNLFWSITHTIDLWLLNLNKTPVLIIWEYRTSYFWPKIHVKPCTESSKYVISSRDSLYSSKTSFKLRWILNRIFCWSLQIKHQFFMNQWNSKYSYSRAHLAHFDSRNPTSCKERDPLYFSVHFRNNLHDKYKLSRKFLLFSFFI